MLSSRYRLQKKKDIDRVFRKGKSFREDSLVLKTTKNDLGFSRFGFVVSQKVAKKASVRNKIKRRLREVVRLKIKQLGVEADNLFIALRGIEGRNFKGIDESVDALFKKAKIYVQ